MLTIDPWLSQMSDHQHSSPPHSMILQLYYEYSYQYTDAFYSRWIVIPFNNSVFGREDPDLTAKLTTQDELSGILNFGLEGLNRLRSNGWRFTYNDDGAALYRRASNPLYAFLEDCCETSENSYVVRTDLMAAYNEYAKLNGLPMAISKQAFGSQMKDQIQIPVETFHPSMIGKQVEAWGGIKLKA